MEELIYEFLKPMNLFIVLAVIVVMLVALSKGADLLVDEAVSLSVKWGVPKMIIGATIVSIGTTLPEATVSVLAAVNGAPDLALGNGIGSIIADTALIIGLAAMIGVLPVEKLIIKRQGRLQIIAGILLALAAVLPYFFFGENYIYQWVGWIFVVLLILYIYISIKWSKGKNLDSLDTPAATEQLEVDKSPIIVIIIKLLIGVILVIGSSNVLIPSVKIFAEAIKIPEGVIAATLVAFGTSLPELVTAVTAVRKGQGSLAIGNVVGADILNVLFVIGVSASVTAGGLKVPQNFYYLQIPAMFVVLMTFRFFSLSNKHKITKLEGLLLFSMYLVYLVLNYIIN